MTVGLFVASNFQIGKKKWNKNVYGICKCKPERLLFGNAVIAELISGREYDVIPQNGDFGFSKQSLLSKSNVITELNMEQIHL
jgi:hypothetical protein